MKYLNLLSLVLFFSVISSCNQQKTELHYINLYTTTIVAVRCENLKKYTNLKTVTLSQNQDKKLIQLLSTLKPLKEKQSIDARLFGSLYQKSQKIDICMSINIIEINGKQYFVSSDLKDYLMSIMKEKAS